MTDASAATLESHRRLLAARPILTRIVRLGDAPRALAPRGLLHAGPPFPDPRDLPAPVFNGAVAAARLEGWAETPEAVRAMLAEGEIALAPAQDHGVVTPLAFVAGPGTPALEVADAAEPERRVLSPLNDGPPPFALRFGTGRADGIDFARQLRDSLADELAGALNAPASIPPLMAGALGEGDDLHGKVSALQTRVPGLFAADLSQPARAYLDAANQFGLNLVMAAAALMLAAGAGVPDSTMVVAAGGNGRDFGWKLAGDPDAWRRAPAAPPAGPRLPDCQGLEPLPAIGDSAVIDALGFGAACLRFAPALAEAFRDHADPAFLTPGAHDAFIGPHPAFPADIRLGLDPTRPRACLGVMLGALDARGEHGLIGRGIAPWPDA